jgi:ornithine cyclodeaminase/alanine dehydrogenase-like protein (mu-crystallin family)
LSNGTSISDVADGPRYVSASQVRTTMSVTAALSALERGLLARRQDEIMDIPRIALPIPQADSASDDEMLLMPAHGPEGAGLKLVTIARQNPARGFPLIQGLYVLLSRDSLTPELLIDGAALTGLRTAAVSALATKYLARPSSRHLVVIGAGAQGTAHVEAMRAVLPIERVTVVGSSPESPRAVSLVARLRDGGIDAAVGDAATIRTADVICTCTTSTAPVFDDVHVKAGTHINAVGAYRLDMRELPAETLRRALLVVESVGATLEEAGDVVSAIEAGVLPEQGFARELAAVLEGQVHRTDDAQVTIFKSVGLSVEDLILARAIADSLRAEPVGAPSR